MTILLAYVPRPEGRAALAKGIELARRLDEPLLLLNASAGTPMDDGSIASRDEIDRIQEALDVAGIKAEIRQHLRGMTPVDEIQTILNHQDISLIVIGMRKRSAVGKLLLGSVAQEILLSAPCPVLSVKAL